MQEGTVVEMEECILKLGEGAEQQKQEERQISHKAIVEQLTAGVEGAAKMPHQVTMPTPWRRGATLSRTRQEDAVEGVRMNGNSADLQNRLQVGQEFQLQGRRWEDLELRKKRRNATFTEVEDFTESGGVREWELMVATQRFFWTFRTTVAKGSSRFSIRWRWRNGDRRMPEGRR